MSGSLEQYETEHLLEWVPQLQQNIAAIEEAFEKALAKEKATLAAVELELKVRERQEV